MSSPRAVRRLVMWAMTCALWLCASRASAADQEPPSDPQSAPARQEPTVRMPNDPNEVPPEMAERIGSDYMGAPPAPKGEVRRTLRPYLQENQGDYQVRLVPPFYLEHERTALSEAGEPQGKDTESLYGMLYYRRRSPKFDADVLFPLAWRVRDRDKHAFVLGPLAHRHGPGVTDNWLAPLVFMGSRPDGGYFHSPLLLTTSHWNAEGAFTLAGPYFRDRTGSDVDWGVAPFVFRGDNGNIDGARKTYTLIPPALFYNRENELEDSRLTVVGPVISRSDPKRGVLDVAPLFFHIWGKPESGGVRESHTTLFPFFHYGTSPTQNLLVLPGYLRRVTPTVDTLLTPLFSRATTRKGSTLFYSVGPIAPLFFRYRDQDIGFRSWALLPFFYNQASPNGYGFWTPLFAHFETYGVSRSNWVFPTLTVSTSLSGWETNLHPLVYLGREKDSSHTVFAPVFWDFANPKGRTTIGFPFFWRFADTADSSVTQVALNTLYRQKRVPGGLDWQFHLLPLFSYGDNPEGHWWNVLFGLVGYDRTGPTAHVKALWLPIQVAGPR